MPPAVNRHRQPDLREQLLVGDGAAVLAEHPFSDGSLVRGEDLAQAGDHRLDIHHVSLETKTGPPEKFPGGPAIRQSV